MNIKSRKDKLQKLIKDAEQDAKIKKIAEDVNDATDPTDYSEKVFDKLLDAISIPGLED